MAAAVRQDAGIGIDDAARHDIQGIGLGRIPPDLRFQIRPDTAVEIIVLGGHVRRVKSRDIRRIRQPVRRRELVAPAVASPIGSGSNRLLPVRMQEGIIPPGIGPAPVSDQGFVERIGNPAGEVRRLIIFERPVPSSFLSEVISPLHVVGKPLQAVTDGRFRQLKPADRGDIESVCRRRRECFLDNRQGGFTSRRRKGQRYGAILSLRISVVRKDHAVLVSGSG